RRAGQVQPAGLRSRRVSLREKPRTDRDRGHLDTQGPPPAHPESAGPQLSVRSRPGEGTGSDVVSEPRYDSEGLIRARLASLQPAPPAPHPRQRKARYVTPEKTTHAGGWVARKNRAT